MLVLSTDTLFSTRLPSLHNSVLVSKVGAILLWRLVWLWVS